MIWVTIWCFYAASLRLPCGRSLDSSPVLLTCSPLMTISKAVLNISAVICFPLACHLPHGVARPPRFLFMLCT